MPDQAEAALELSLVEEAEMVFTTLSSTGRRIFQRLSQPFRTVLIDEAAQASEVAALQPLAFGCQRCARRLLSYSLTPPATVWVPAVASQSPVEMLCHG